MPNTSLLRRQASRVVRWRYGLNGTVLPSVAIALTAALLFSLIFFGTLRLVAEDEISALEKEMASRTAAAAVEMERRLDAAASDVVAAAQSPSLVELASGDPTARDKVQRLLGSFVDAKNNIESFRYIDSTGREVVVADRSNREVRDADGLFDQDNYFIGHARTLQPGQVGVSEFNLRTVDGELTTPLRPIIRIATPVLDSSGMMLRGVLVLDIDGNRVVEQSRSDIGVEFDAGMVDEQGEWLVASQAEKQWSALLGGPAFRDEWAEAWELMKGQESGADQVPQGIVAFATAHPTEVAARLRGDQTKPPTGEFSSEWKVIASVPRAEMPSAGLSRGPVETIAYFGALLVLGAGAFIIANLLMVRGQLRRSVRENAMRVAAIRDNLSDGLIAIDADGIITDVNPEAERLLGWTREELLGQEAHAALHNHPDRAIEWQGCAFDQVMSTGHPYRNDAEVFTRRDGVALHVGASAARLYVDRETVGAVIVFRDNTDIRRYQEEIRRLAFHDDLTGLPNRRVFRDRLDQAIARADREPVTVGVMFLDLDGFKRINDDYGHDIGDEFLKAVAERIRGCMRSTDTLARHGGDEFVVLLPEIEGVETAEAVARRVLTAFEEPFMIEGITLKGASSIGIAVRGDGENSDDVLSSADKAMYEAKQSGANRYCVSGRDPVASWA